MDIKVASASSLFKENGHDLKGIFNLFYNAVSQCISINTIDAYCTGGEMLFGGKPVVPDDREFLTGCIIHALENFHPDLEKSASRIAQFNQEYKELKEMSAKIKEVSFWTVITRSNKQINAYIKRKREIESETISLDELLNIAYYKFSQVNGTFKQFREGFNRFLEMK